MANWKKAALWGGVGLAVLTVGIGMSRASAPGGFLARRLRMAELMKELRITPQQGRQLREAALHLRVERRGLDLEELSPSDRRERLFQLRRAFFARAEQILTPEQTTLLKARWESGRAARQERFEKRALAAADRLHLTTEQRARAREVFASARTRVEQLRSDPSLDEPSRLARMLGVLEETRGQLYRLLSPEQKEKARGLIEQRLRDQVPADNLAEAGADPAL